MNYPVLAIEPRGFTEMIQSEAYWASLPIGFVGLYQRRLDVLVFYGKDGNKWQLRSIKPIESIGMLRRFLHASRPVHVLVEFKSGGRYPIEEFRASFRSAVEADDDILCQYYDQQQILRWVDQASSIPRLFNLYSWITKEFVRRKRREERARRLKP